MQVYVIYKKSNGKLISISTNPISNDKNSREVIGPIQKTARQVWDETTLTFIDPPPPRKISVDDFFNRFTKAELKQVLAVRDTNENIRWFIFLADLAELINLDKNRTSNFVADVRAEGIIDAARELEVLA